MGGCPYAGQDFGPLLTTEEGDQMLLALRLDPHGQVIDTALSDGKNVPVTRGEGEAQHNSAGSEARPRDHDLGVWGADCRDRSAKAQG